MARGGLARSGQLAGRVPLRGGDPLACMVQRCCSPVCVSVQGARRLLPDACLCQICVVCECGHATGELHPLCIPCLWPTILIHFNVASKQSFCLLKGKAYMYGYYGINYLLMVTFLCFYNNNHLMQKYTLSWACAAYILGPMCPFSCCLLRL